MKLFAAILMLSTSLALCQQDSSSSKRYVPPELQASDPEVRRLLDAADNMMAEGKYSERTQDLQEAFELCQKKSLVADKAIVEARLAVMYFSDGKLDKAKQDFQNSFSDAVNTSNLVLQADTLVALATFSQTTGKIPEELTMLSEALELARKSKNLFIQARVLGEMGRTQLNLGKKAEARTSIDEALTIDRLNGYDWEAVHLLYSAWINATGPDSNLDEAITQATAARNLSIQKENYLVFVQASTWLAKAYVRKGRVDDGIDLLKRSRDGLSETNNPLFKNTPAYKAAAALPFLRVVFLESLAQACETGQRPDEALGAWTDLYSTGKAAEFTLVTAEAAHSLADLYKARKELDKSISYYAIAADAWAAGGNEQRRIDALSVEASLLYQQDQKDKELQVVEELLPLARTSKNVTAQFMADVAVAEVLGGTAKLDRVESALKDADSLVDSDMKVPGVGPNLMVELYSRLADLYEKRKDPLQGLIALEKAITPALALSSAPGDTKDGKPLASLVPLLEATIEQSHVRDTAEKIYAAGNFADALVYFEVLRYFDETDAAWHNRYEEYTTKLNNDTTNTRLLQIPLKVISQGDGAAILAKNIEDMGPIANPVRLTSLGILTSYYMAHQRPDMMVKFARQALSSVKLAENETPTPWYVAMSCELATALMLEKDLKSAVEVLGPCMAGAKTLGIPELLQGAHQTNVLVLEAAGKHDEAQESIQFLLRQKPDDPQGYVQLAQAKAQQGDEVAASDAWRKAIQLYEAREDKRDAADAHLALANLLTFGTGADPEGERAHLEAADDLYRQLGSSEGRVNAEASLGTYYAAHKNDDKSHQYFEGALRIARDVKRKGLEAHVLSQIGQAYEASDRLSQAIDSYIESADLYQQQNDPGDEAFQLKNLANVLNSLHRPEEALQIILKAKAAGDRSNSWLARYWVRRTLAIIYANQGQYQNGVSALREAKQISDDANQPLNSAWAALDLAAGLETIGNWQEASEQINSAIPILKQFKDTDDESFAYMDLMEIYSARESELQDLPKALHFYQTAYELVSRTHPDRAATLDLNLTEIYWGQGRFKDAIVKASEALEYYKKLKDELNEAGALISLAEAQRSDGDLTAAANSLQLAEPLVDRVKNFYTLGRLYYGLAGLYRAQGRLNDAIEQYERVIKMLEQFKSSSNPENQRHVAEHYDFIYDELIEAYYALAQSDKQHAGSAADKAFEYAELNKSRIFARSWGQVFIDGLKRQVPAQLQERERVLLAQQTALQSGLQESMEGTAHESVEQVEKALDSARKEQSELVQQLRDASPAYAEARYPQPIALVQIPVHSDELLVEFKMLQDSVLVWMVGGSAGGGHLVAFYKVDRPRQWFGERIFSFREAFNTDHRFDPRISEELFNSLFPEPFAEHLTTAQSVVFIPDDILFLLPFEMLSPRASQGQFVLLKTATEYFPSAAVLKLSRAAIREHRPAWQEQFIGIADPITSQQDPRYVAATILSESKPTKPELAQDNTPAFRGISVDKIRSGGISLERLPDSATEVNSIASLFPGGASTTEVRTGVNATKQKLMQTDLDRFRFVHFATHGILPVEAGIKEPALVLSYEGTNRDDMLLTLSEVFQLKLRADMVVLSACNTGRGKVTRAEGVASLGTAFLAAGASSVTVSLWQVNDNSTAILMKEFYRNLVNGIPKAAALAAARASLASVSDEYKNPFYWAPFVLTGE